MARQKRIVSKTIYESKHQSGEGRRNDKMGLKRTEGTQRRKYERLNFKPEEQYLRSSTSTASSGKGKRGKSKATNR